MKFQDQGTIDNRRYTVIPRTLSFVCSNDEILLLRGAPDKRLWAHKLNGLGGHIEPGEDPYDGALREIWEEAGIRPKNLTLKGLVHISGQDGHPGVMLFVFVGEAPSHTVSHSREGHLEWHPIADLPTAEIVGDLPYLLPRVLNASPEDLVFGHYETDDKGDVHYHWNR